VVDEPETTKLVCVGSLISTLAFGYVVGFDGVQLNPVPEFAENPVAVNTGVVLLAGLVHVPLVEYAVYKPPAVHLIL
jgi:cytochrome bd-type quinol oxidase subunit 2